jgi:hypothetical protein
MEKPLFLRIGFKNACRLLLAAAFTDLLSAVSALRSAPFVSSDFLSSREQKVAEASQTRRIVFVR